MFEPIIGLEIHIQLKTRSKMFCASPNQEGAEPNTNICEVCTGQPGVLPVANQEAIEKAIMMGLSLNCEIPQYSKFDRKNYFYPDLPKGYQISQFDAPLCGRGALEIVVNDQKKTVHITRAHLEEDAGKLIHPKGAKYSLVDFNRAGIPLLEVVTEPDLKSPFEARVFLQQLRTIARYLEISDTDMEKGQLRCDANISLREVKTEGSDTEYALPAYKVEIKNLNSFKAVEEALAYEISRQKSALQSGEHLTTETRGWSEAKRVTVPQRTKEGSEDYRYFPEPDLPTLYISEDLIKRLQARLPELPFEKHHRFVAEYHLPNQTAWQLVAEKELGEYFEKITSELKEWLSVEKVGDPSALLRNIKEAANWCVGIFTEFLNDANTAVTDTKITPENFAELLKMVEKGEVSKTAAKQVFEEMFKTGGDPSNILEDKGLKQISDVKELEELVKKVIEENPEVVKDYKAGKKQALGFLVGQVMAKTKGKANPAIVNELITKII